MPGTEPGAGAGALFDELLAEMLFDEPRADTLFDEVRATGSARGSGCATLFDEAVGETMTRDDSLRSAAGCAALRDDLGSAITRGGS